MQPQYLIDSYQKEFETEVKSVKDGKFVVLGNTLFYPNAGGQLYDTGILVRESDNKEFKVVYVGKFGGEISHEIEPVGLDEGDKVLCKLDWDRRYKLMRNHTAAHVLSRVLHEETGAVTSGNQLGLDKSRIDFTLENMDKEKMIECVEKANELIANKAEVHKSFMNKEEAFKLPGFAKVSPHLVQDFDTLRVVDIEGVDAQPCGGTHLDNIGEIGKIEFLKAENKGKNKRRIYYKVVD